MCHVRQVGHVGSVCSRLRGSVNGPPSLSLLISTSMPRPNHLSIIYVHTMISLLCSCNSCLFPLYLSLNMLIDLIMAIKFHLYQVIDLLPRV